jgi:hypothetical protein
MKRGVTMWQRLQTYALGVGALLLGAAVVMVFAFVTTALLILRDKSAPVGATPPAAAPYRAKWPSDQGAAQLPSAPAKAGRTPADQASREPAAYRNPDVVPRSTRTKALETIDPRELLRQGKSSN